MQHTPLGYCCRGREKGLTIYQLHNVLGRAISNQNGTHVSIVCVPGCHGLTYLFSLCSSTPLSTAVKLEVHHGQLCAVAIKSFLH